MAVIVADMCQICAQQCAKFASLWKGERDIEKCPGLEGMKNEG